MLTGVAQDRDDRYLPSSHIRHLRDARQSRYWPQVWLRSILARRKDSFTARSCGLQAPRSWTVGSAERGTYFETYCTEATSQIINTICRSRNRLGTHDVWLVCSLAVTPLNGYVEAHLRCKERVAIECMGCRLICIATQMLDPLVATTGGGILSTAAELMQPSLASATSTTSATLPAA